MNNYGECLRDGTGVDVNLVEAAKLFKRAADLGLVEAQVNYGNCLLYGQGVSEDTAEAERYHRMATEQENQRDSPYELMTSNVEQMEEEDISEYLYEAFRSSFDENDITGYLETVRSSFFCGLFEPNRITKVPSVFRTERGMDMHNFDIEP